MKPIRKIRIDGDVAYVPLTKGYEAVVDASDIGIVDGFNWTAVEAYRPDRSIRAVYAYRKSRCNGKQSHILMHREIFQPEDDSFVDHIDGNGLNNRRTNLRSANHSQNQYNRRIGLNNSSGFKGVYWCNSRRKWSAQITVGKKHIWLGYSSSVYEAVALYLKASTEFHKEFSNYQFNAKEKP